MSGRVLPRAAALAELSFRAGSCAELEADRASTRQVPGRAERTRRLSMGFRRREPEGGGRRLPSTGGIALDLALGPRGRKIAALLIQRSIELPTRSHDVDVKSS